MFDYFKYLSSKSWSSLALQDGSLRLEFHDFEVLTVAMLVEVVNANTSLA